MMIGNVHATCFYSSTLQMNELVREQQLCGAVFVMSVLRLSSASAGLRAPSSSSLETRQTQSSTHYIHSVDSHTLINKSLNSRKQS